MLRKSRFDGYNKPQPREEGAPYATPAHDGLLEKRAVVAGEALGALGKHSQWMPTHCKACSRRVHRLNTAGRLLMDSSTANRGLHTTAQ